MDEGGAADHVHEGQPLDTPGNEDQLLHASGNEDQHMDTPKNEDQRKNAPGQEDPPTDFDLDIKYVLFCLCFSCVRQ